MFEILMLSAYLAVVPPELGPAPIILRATVRKVYKTEPEVFSLTCGGRVYTFTGDGPIDEGSCEGLLLCAVLTGDEAESERLLGCK